eukprot:4444256-Lingulodinium_polyedra.AAC.1
MIDVNWGGPAKGGNSGSSSSGGMEITTPTSGKASQKEAKGKAIACLTKIQELQTALESAMNLLANNEYAKKM